MVNGSPVGHYKPESARVDAAMDLVTTSLETVIGGKVVGTGLSKLKQPAKNLIEKVAEKMPEVVKAATKTAVRITTEIKDGAQKLGEEFVEKTTVAFKNSPLGNIRGQVVIREGAEAAEEAVASEAKFVFDARTGQYRDQADGRFVSPKNLPWPGNRGFAANPVDTTLSKGTIIDRFGSLDGRYAGTPGASISKRGMALGSEEMSYTRLEIVKPITVPGGAAAAVPEFGATGGATQYFFKGGLQSWIDSEYLRVLP